MEQNLLQTQRDIPKDLCLPFARLVKKTTEGHIPCSAAGTAPGTAMGREQRDVLAAQRGGQHAGGAGNLGADVTPFLMWAVPLGCTLPAGRD